MTIINNHCVILARRGFRPFATFRRLLLVVAFLVVPFVGIRADESETWSKMLTGLKENGYYDTALEYLEWMKSSPFYPLSLKKQHDYQVANVHLDAIEERAMFLPRDEHVKKCREALERYLKEQPNGEFVFDAVSTQGRLMLEEGRMDIARAKLDTTRDADREQLTQKAREAFRKALPIFEKADKLATEEARKLQAARQANAAAVKDSDLFDAYNRFLVGKILINLVKSDIAKTYPSGSKEFKDGLTAIAKDFEKLGSTYKDYSAGFEAKLHAAKAYRDLGNFKQARTLLGELNILQGNEFIRILTESLLVNLDMSLTEKTPEALADSVNRARGWYDSAPAASKLTPEGQQIYLLAARALLFHAENVKSRRADYDKAVQDAGRFLRQVRSTSSVAREAQELLRTISGVKTDKAAPQTYDEARDYAEDDWKEFVVVFQDLQDAKKPEDQKNIRAKLEGIARTCFASLNRAINMREPGTPISETNAFRLNLVRVYWFLGQSLEAAILADYLAQNFSGESDADKTAGLAVRLYRQAFVEDKRAGHDPTAIADRLMKLCDFIMKRWQGKEVIGEVQLLQIDTAIDNGNLPEAKELLEQTPKGTPQRALAELRIGQSLWNNYVAASRLPEDTEGRPDKKTLDDMLAEARKQFETGLTEKIKLIESGADKVDHHALISAVLLGQIDMNAGDGQKAVDWMTNKYVGPIALMANPPPGIVIDDTMKLNSTMTVLRAYVATENLDMAEKTMDSLETLIKEQTATGTDDPEEKLTAERRLTQIYVSLGRQLENRLKELNEAGEFDQAAKVAKGFELFLTRIKDRGDANSFQSLFWVADTFYRLGSGLTTEGQKLPDDAKKYYNLAVRTYREINDRILNEPGWGPVQAEKTVNIRLAESLRCIGMYELALRFLVAVIKDDGNRLDAQIEAAKALEAWGSQDLEKLYRAIAGRYPDPLIWGWGKIITQTKNDMSRFGEFYYNAYLSKLRCCLEIYKAETNPEKKAKALNVAINDVAQLLQTRQLDNPEFFAQLDRLYRNLQRAEGVARPQTLRQFQQELSIKVVEPRSEETAEEDVSASVKEPEPTVSQPPASDNVLWIILGGTALLCIPLVYFVTARKKKPAPKAEIISIP